MKKRVIFILLIMVSVIFMSGSVTFPVSAEPQNTNTTATTETTKTDDTKDNETKDDDSDDDGFGITYPKDIKDKGTRKAAYFLVYTVLHGNLGETMETVMKGKTTAQILDSSKTLYEAAEKLGGVLVVMYFLMELIDQSTRENFSLEHFFKLMMKLIIAKFILEHGFDILSALSSAATDQIKVLYSSIDGGNQTVLVYWQEKISKAKTTECLVIIIQWLVPYLLTYIGRLIVMVVLYGRYIEIGLRAALAPVGMSDIFSQGANAAGFRYMKKFMAVCLQAAVIIVILNVGAVCESELVMGTGAVSTVMGAVIFNLTIAGMVVRSGQISNDIMGV